MNYDLWTEATYDLGAEQRTRSMEMAKHASQGVWAFLAQAQSDVEYADRLDLASERIAAVASATDTPVEDLLAVFEQRFAVLAEAKGNPFGSDDDGDDDDTDEDGDGSTDDDGQDGDQGDEGDSGGDPDDSDDSDTDEDDDDTDDDSSDDQDDDSSGKDGKGGTDPTDDGSDGTPPFPRQSRRYASLLDRIEAGENPLSWGSGPFVRSSARKHAVGADEGTVSDTAVPQPGADSGLGGAPVAPPSLPETSKPRQLPSGGGEMGVDPALNGADLGPAGNSGPPDSPEGRIAAIAAEVRRYNPHLSNQQCVTVAFRVSARYLRREADVSPLLYGDRGDAHDGPLTNKVKTWQPPAPRPGMPPVPGAPAAAEEGEALAGVETAADLAPLLAL